MAPHCPNKKAQKLIGLVTINPLLPISHCSLIVCLFQKLKLCPGSIHLSLGSLGVVLRFSIPSFLFLGPSFFSSPPSLLVSLSKSKSNPSFKPRLQCLCPQTWATKSRLGGPVDSSDVTLTAPHDAVMSVCCPLTICKLWETRSQIRFVHCRPIALPGPG